ncbi:substrate-binding periplasmic protein [Parasedimentitalea denitrificans]|nr:transporter substrate-binding domain-containing protein [Sedimentitalea sp. CY04]
MTEIANEAAHNTGIKTTVSNQRFPWKRLLKNLERGQFDILAGVYNDYRNEIQYGYSLPVTTNNIHIVVKSGREFPFSKFGDLLGKKGVHFSGATHGKEFEAFSKQNLDLYEVNNENQMFDMLVGERMDYGIGSIRAMTKFVQDENYEGKLSILSHPLTENHVYFLFSRKSPCYPYIEQFNQEILKMQENGTIQEIESKYP